MEEANNCEQAQSPLFEAKSSYIGNSSSKGVHLFKNVVWTSQPFGYNDILSEILTKFNKKKLYYDFIEL